MKQKTVKLLSLLLTLAMLFSLLPAQALAEDRALPEAQLEAAAAPAEEPDGLLPPPEKDLSGIRINPLYADVLSLEDAAEHLPDPDGAESVTYDYTTLEEAAALLRESMIAREELIVFHHPDPDSIDGNALVELAFSHTGNPIEGDYLRWQYGAWLPATSGQEYRISIWYYTSAEMEAELDTAVEELLGQLALDGKSEYEIIRGVYEYICENIVYDYDHLDNDPDYWPMYTAYAALIDKTAVCQGYALLLYRLLLTEGVDCRIVTSVDHAWNIVAIEGLYYNVDSTWDAGSSVYSWFLRCMAHFPDHEREAPYDGEEFNARYPMSPQDYAIPSPGLLTLSATDVTLTVGGEAQSVLCTPDDSLENYGFSYAVAGGDCAAINFSWQGRSLEASLTPKAAGAESLFIYLTDGGENILDQATIYITVRNASVLPVALITDSGDIDDGAFNQICYEAVRDYCEAGGAGYGVYRPEQDDDAARIAQIEAAIADGYTVLVLPGASFASPIASTAPLHPEVRFISLDLSADDLNAVDGAKGAWIPDNVHLILFREEQAGFLAGYAAVRLGYTRLGFLGGMAIPAIKRYGYGFVQGANAAAKRSGADVAIEYAYAGQFWGDDALTAAMDGWYGEGVEVVFACGGGLWTSVAEAAARNGGKIIGVDSDQAAVIDGMYGEGLTLTSAMKNLRAAIGADLDALRGGSFPGGQEDRLGLVNAYPDQNFVGLAPSTQYNDSFTASNYTSLLVMVEYGLLTVSDDIGCAPGDYATDCTLTERELHASVPEITEAVITEVSNYSHYTGTSQYYEGAFVVWKEHVLLNGTPIQTPNGDSGYTVNYSDEDLAALGVALEWYDAATDEPALIDYDGSNVNLFTGPARIGSYYAVVTQTVNGVRREVSERVPFEILPTRFAKFTDYEDMTTGSRAYLYSILGEADGQLYAMAMPTTEGTYRCEAIPVTADEDGVVTLGYQRENVFCLRRDPGHHSYGDAQHPTRELLQPVTGTSWNVFFGGPNSCIWRGGGWTGDDGFWFNTDADNDYALEAYEPNMRHGRYILCKDSDGEVFFSREMWDTGAPHASLGTVTVYPVYLYWNQIPEGPIGSHSYEFVGTPYDKVYDGEPVSFDPYKNILVDGGKTSWGELEKMGTARVIWQQLVDKIPVEIPGAPVEIGQYLIVIQELSGKDWVDVLSEGVAITAPETPEGLPIDEEHFPDENFRAYVAEALDPDGDGYLSDAEIAAVTEINCQEREIADLSGIEYFPALTTLSCMNNELTELTLGSLEKLEVLYCSDNQLTALDLSGLPALQKLEFDNNGLTAIDLSENSKLTLLNCSGNPIAAIDVSQNSKLATFYCTDTPLTALNLGANPELSILNCYHTQIDTLDLRGNPILLEAAKGDYIEKDELPGVRHYGPFQPIPGIPFTIYRLVVDASIELITHVHGDVTGDGALDGRDAIRLQRFLSGQDVDFDALAADVTGDGIVDGRDFIRLMKYLAGQDVVLY